MNGPLHKRRGRTPEYPEKTPDNQLKNWYHILEVKIHCPDWGLNPHPLILVKSLLGQNAPALTHLTTGCCYGGLGGVGAVYLKYLEQPPRPSAQNSTSHITPCWQPQNCTLASERNNGVKGCMPSSLTSNNASARVFSMVRFRSSLSMSRALDMYSCNTSSRQKRHF